MEENSPLLLACHMATNAPAAVYCESWAAKAWLSPLSTAISMICVCIIAEEDSVAHTIVLFFHLFNHFLFVFGAAKGENVQILVL